MRVHIVASLLVFSTCFSACQAVSRPAAHTNLIQIRLQLAAEYLRLGQLDSAKLSLDQALAIEPRSADALLMMALILKQEGSVQNQALAENYFKHALMVRPDFPQAHNNYGVYLFEQQRYDQAIQHLSLAASSLGYAARSEALENLGRAYLIINQSANARHSFERALQLNQASPIALLELTELSLQQNNHIEARRFFSRYIDLIGKSYLGQRAQRLQMQLFQTVD